MNKPLFSFCFEIVFKLTFWHTISEKFQNNSNDCYKKSCLYTNSWYYLHLTHVHTHIVPFFSRSTRKTSSLIHKSHDDDDTLMDLLTLLIIISDKVLDVLLFFFAKLFLTSSADAVIYRILIEIYYSDWLLSQNKKNINVSKFWASSYHIDTLNLWTNNAKTIWIP